MRLATVLLAASALACGDGGEPSGDLGPEIPSLGRPTIVLVVFDALHAGHLGHLGYERDTTPHLDALAAEGVSFSRAFAPAPYTLASIPSLLTGRRPDTHGVTSVSARLSQEETTLAEVLARTGYRTVAAVGNFNGSARTGADQGFEVFREMFRDPEAALDPEHAGEDAFRLATADMFVEFSSGVLEGDGRPLFLYLHILEPHAPYVMPDEYRGLWLDPAYEGRFASGATQPFIDSLNDSASVAEDDVEAAIALYDGNLKWADHNFGLLRQQLERAGLWDEALVIVTSDHGEAFWQHGRWGHNDHLFDEQLRVPLIVKPPASRDLGGLRGTVRDDLVSVMDVTPSVCQWLDVAPGHLPLDGHSIAALCERPDWRPEGRELLLRTHQGIANLGLRTANEKTIVERGPKLGDKPRGHVVRTLHFDLDVDAEEQQDLYQDRKQRADAHAARLIEWGQGAILERSERGTGLTPAEVALLRGLGYVDTPPAFESRDEGLDEQ